MFLNHSEINLSFCGMQSDIIYFCIKFLDHETEIYFSYFSIPGFLLRHLALRESLILNKRILTYSKFIMKEILFILKVILEILTQ